MRHTIPPDLQIREATSGDFDEIWPIFHSIASAGSTDAYPTDTTKAEAEDIWMRQPHATFVAEIQSEIAGTYYLKTSQYGPGSHVCNCGYMVAANARGQGLATAMCKHSQQQALTLGYRAIQFNFVASTNTGAIRLWQKLGFDIVGRPPGAFNHPKAGYVDALVMYTQLAAGYVD